MTDYKCVKTNLSWLRPEDVKKYSIWSDINTYGRRALGNPPLDLEPKVTGLLKDDAIFWALGQAYIILRNQDWKITKLDIEGDKNDYIIKLEDELGAVRTIHIAQEDEPS